MALFRPTHIMIHHSATEQGNAASFRVYHKSKGWSDIGYHYVICNGHGGQDGEIQPGRPASQAGAHCLEGNMNQKALAICLVGNFDDHKPSQAQYKSLVSLVQMLMKKHEIPVQNIVMHRQYAINKATGKPYKSCPGWAFDLEELKQMLVAEVINMVFKDVPDNHWAIEDIRWAKENGLVRGDEQGNFGLGKPLMREEAVALLHRLEKRLLKLLGVQ